MMRLLAILLLLCGAALAQAEAPSFRQIVKQPDFTIPALFLVGSMASDAYLSNRYAGVKLNQAGYICAWEGNPLFVTRGGGFSVGKFAAVNGPKLAFVGLGYLARKKAPQSKAARILTSLFMVGSGTPHAYQSVRWMRACN